MRWDESPRFLLIASVASAVLSAALSLAAIWDHPGYNVAASVLALPTVILAYGAFERSTHRRLGRIQREHLVLQLRQLPANVASTGLFVAVPDGNFPSEEERCLLLALSEFGMHAVKSTSPKLTHLKVPEPWSS